MRPTSVAGVIVGTIFAFTGCGGKAVTEPTEFGNDAGGVPAICASSVDEEPLAVPVVIRNDLPFTIYLGKELNSCLEPSLFRVRDAAGRLTSAKGRCRSSCKWDPAGNPQNGCFDECRAEEAVRLEPGKFLSTSWAGTQCAPARVIPTGMLTFGTDAGTALDCSVGECNCEPDATGTCTVAAAFIRGVPLSTLATVELDSKNKGVTLSFSYCTGPWYSSDCG